MAWGQPKKRTEAERVKIWKKKNPDKVHGQQQRKRARERAERRAQDPTGELFYGPIEGVDEPYPDSSEMPPVPKPEPTPGIPDPEDFVAELSREEKRLTLERLRAELAKIEPKKPQ